MSTANPEPRSSRRRVTAGRTASGESAPNHTGGTKVLGQNQTAAPSSARPLLPRGWEGTACQVQPAGSSTPQPDPGLRRRQVGRRSLLVQGSSQDVLAIRRELDKGHGGVVVICTETEGLTHGAEASAGVRKGNSPPLLRTAPCSGPREAMPPCGHHQPEGACCTSSPRLMPA